MKYLGYDITQHKTFKVTASADDEGKMLYHTHNVYASLPSAILPTYKRESVLLSTEDKHSRRGLGLLWPRDTQVPVGGGENWTAGCGRVPLLSCLSNIKAAGDADEWKIIDSQTNWTPHIGQPPLSFSNASLLSHLFDKSDADNQKCFVIPEGFNESAQQTLLEAFPENTYLIPRSIALAMKWCAEHKELSQDSLNGFENERSLGYLLCASLGFGEWEVSLIEIKAKRFNQQIYLVPVYSPTVYGQGLNFCGIALCHLFMQSKKGIISEQAVWLHLTNTQWFESVLQHRNEIDLATQDRLVSVLSGASSTNIPYAKLPFMNGLVRKHNPSSNLKNQIHRMIQQQKNQLGQDLTILGVACGGSFAELPVHKNISYSIPPDSLYMRMNEQQLKRQVALGVYQAIRAYQYRFEARDVTLAEYLFPSNNISVYGAQVFAEGAALASYCIGNHLPAFDIKLIPLHLYTVKRNGKGDKAEHWACLVPEGTIGAGEQSKMQIVTGLSIPEGKEHLELTLMRQINQNEPIYRKVDAKIPTKTDKQEPVIIKAQVKPGQGFAKVTVNSETSGVFTAHLDWKTMQTVSKPELKLEYIPDAAFIVSDQKLWNAVDQEIRQFIKTANGDGKFIRERIDGVRKYLNRWTMDKYSQNVFRHLGAIDSTGNENKLCDKRLLFQFRDNLERAWKEYLNPTIKNKLLRLGGWLYLYIPQSMLDEVSRQLKCGTARSEALNVVGMSFHEDVQMKLFYTAFIENFNPNSDWFRALKNMLRFRDQALSDDIVSKEQITSILHTIMGVLREGIESSKRKYNCCIEALIYILKRRRYDETFLAAGADDTLELRDLLIGIMKNHQTEKYRKIAQTTLAFLNREATNANVAAILEATGDSDDD